MREPSATILFVIPGKIERVTGGSIYDKKLAESLVEQGFRLEIISVPDLPYLSALVAGLVIAPLLMLRLSRGKHDLVIEDGWAHPAAVLFNIACRFKGKVPLVVITHQVRSQAVGAPLTFLAQTIERVALRAAQLIVAVSQFTKREVEQLVGSSEHIFVALPGSTLLSKPIPECGDGTAPLRLLFVGNCTPIKGLDHLIQALALLSDLPLRLDVVGDVNCDSRYYRSLRRLAKTLAVDERVAFHGLVSHDDLAGFYARADIFAFPSLYEGFGIVLGEAMHAGLAIVATRTGPVNEIVREGENALLVPPADSRALASAIRKLATDPPVRMSFSRCSSELATSLPTWEETCGRMCRHLRMIIRTPRDTKQSTKLTPKQLP